jgi:3-oxoacyl-[acyl-carrier protein] reductase
MTNSGLIGRVAIVTGASRGLGEHIAVGLARRGASVVINFRSSADAAQRVVERIEQAGGRAFAAKADVGDEGETRAMVDEAVERFGPIDVLVLNAVGEVLRGPALEQSPTRLAAAMTEHFLQCTVPVYAVAPAMAARGQGSVILISDTFSHRLIPGGLGHALPKVPVETAIRYLALEVGGANVRFNTVISGAIRSEAYERALDNPVVAAKMSTYLEQVPLGRIAEPGEVADVVAALAGDQFGYVTGAALPVAGGYLA